MKTHRDGEPVVVCDGCHRVIENASARMHTVSTKSTGWDRPTDACSTACVKVIRAHPPTEQRCKECNIRVATGELACMNGHTQAVAGRVKGVGVKSA